MAKIQDKLVDVKGLRHIYEDLAGWINDVHSEFNDRVNNKLGAATNVPVPGQMLIADDNFSWTWKNMPAHISEADVRRIVNEQLAKIKGTIKDTFVHVDDAFPSTLLGIEIEGACKQDGTPSPDNPVPIHVIEHPVVQVRGRNFWDKGIVIYNYNKDYLKYNPEASVKMEPGTYIISSDGRLPNLQFFEPDSHEQITCAEATDGVGSGTEYDLVWDGYCIAPYTEMTKPFYITLTRPLEMTVCVVNNYGTWIQIERGTEVTAYEPYVGTSLTFTLPAEHPYLAKLPDGTADKIVVDKDGNATLVAGVNRVLLDKTEGWNFEKTGGGNGIYKYIEDSRLMSPVLSKFGVGEYMFAPDKTFIDNAHNLFLVDSNLTTIDDIIAYFGSGSYVYYPLATNVTYHLGKVTVPSLPDSISNIWTDAEVTPRTSIEYVRDVNIVVENLESAIASITEG